MATARPHTAAEDQARSEPWCRGCGKDKGSEHAIGALVCWDCFKRHPKGPMKYYRPADFVGWLREVGGILDGLPTTDDEGSA